MDKNEIATLLEALCERPFEGAEAGQPLAMQVIANPTAPAPGDEAENPGHVTAEFASILSGTATDVQCDAFQEAAMASSAVRLEALSGLAFVNGIERAPLAAPAHLVEQVLASGSSAPLVPKPGIRSRLSGGLVGARRGQMAAACAVMVMAGGLSWSLLWRPADLGADGSAVPVVTNPRAEPPPISGIGPNPGPAPAVPMPAPAPAPTPKPLAPVQALADPCEPRSFATSEVGARSKVESKAAKPAPDRQSKTAAVSAPEPGCAVNAGAIEAGRNPQADQGPVRAARPAAKIGRFDRDPPAAAASAPAAAPYPGAAPPASPALRPGAIEQRR